MNDFDQAARFSAKLDPVGFFRWLLPDLPAEWTFRRWRDTRTLPFPGEPDRTCDTVAEFENTAEAGRCLLVVTEFQSHPRADMLVRLLEYQVRVLREPDLTSVVEPSVVAALLNLTGPSQLQVLEMRLPGRPQVGLWFGVQLRTLREEDAAETMNWIAKEKIARTILPFIPLMGSGAEATIIQEWRHAAAAEPNRQRRADYAGLALAFASLAGCRDDWEAALEDWEMYESSYLNKVRAQTKREVLLQILRLRFHQLPEDLMEAISGLMDLEEVTRWLDAAVTAPTLATFRAAVQQEARA